MSGTTDHTELRPRGISAWFDARFRSPAAIYGLLVFTAFIAIDSDHADSAWEILGTSFGTLLVFFLAHVFAHTLTEHGEQGLGSATRGAIRHAAGMLYASLPAVIVLIVGGIQGISPEDVYEIAMWVTLAVLAVLGYTAYARRGAHVLLRLVGAAGTAVLGIFIVLLEWAIH